MAARAPGGAGFAGGLLGRLGGFLGNDTVRSILIWQVAGQIFQPILAPVVAEIAAEIWSAAPDLPLSPADAVDAYIKSHLTEAEARSQVRKSGLGDDAFDALTAISGEPPGVSALLELWRRGTIPESGSGTDSISYEQGVREGRTKNKWIDPLKVLKTALPSPESALEALLEGQTDAENAKTLYEQWGGDPRYFQLMFDTRGSAPTPLEAAEMARRGIIPWEGDGAGVTSFRQAFLEGPWRNKWLEPYHKLSEYIPPPRTVTALVREGAITDADALVLFKDAGLNDKLAAAYLASAHHQSVTADRELSKADVIALYYDRLIDRAAAETMLEGLQFAPSVTAFLLNMADFKRDKAILDQAVAKTRSLYIAHRVSKEQARGSLDGYGLSPANRDFLLLFWDQERDLNVKLLTPAELVRAHKTGLLSESELALELTGQGYTARDAAIYMAINGVAPPKAAPSA